MQAPSVALYAALVPNITNVTLRARYYSFFPWLCDQYAHRRGDPSEKAWIQFLRRAEALLALASCAASPKGECDGAAGVRWASRVWKQRSGDESIDFATGALPGGNGTYLQNERGIFGQVYQSVLTELGIVTSARVHAIPVPAPGRGDALGAAFEASVGQAGVEFIDVLEAGNADAETLIRLGRAMSPEAIPPDSAERACLEAILFADDAPATAGKHARRDTLRLALYAARQLSARPTIDQLRWAFYAHRFEDGTTLVVPESLCRQAERWSAYQANELAHISLEAVLSLLLKCHISETRPVTMAYAVRGLVADLLEGFSPVPHDWARLRAVEEWAESPWDKAVASSERNLADAVFGNDPFEAARAGTRLLAILDRRWAGIQHAVATEFAQGTMIARGSPTVMSVLAFLRHREHEPIERLLAALVQRYVIEQHLRVAMRKLHQQGKRTFHFELENGELIRRFETGPVYTTPRLGTSLAFLRDLHLLGDNGPTAAGLAVLGAA
jgi:hypothetical protein